LTFSGLELPAALNLITLQFCPCASNIDWESEQCKQRDARLIQFIKN
jgi:hypothetical protein